MQVRCLGALSVVRDGVELEIRSATHRRALLFLTVHLNQVVSSDRLAEAIWRDRVPSDPRHAVHSLVHRLRHQLAADGVSPLQRHDPGYVLALDPQVVDSQRFCELVRNGYAAAGSRPEEARTSLSSALSLWRGDPLLDVAYEPWAAAEIRRLSEHRVSACELLARLNIDLGEGELAIADLESLTEQFPLRESLWILLWEALAQTGRHLEVAASYRRAVERLAHEYGVEPTPHLHEAGRRLGEALST